MLIDLYSVTVKYLAFLVLIIFLYIRRGSDPLVPMLYPSSQLLGYEKFAIVAIFYFLANKNLYLAMFFRKNVGN